MMTNPEPRFDPELFVPNPVPNITVKEHIDDLLKHAKALGASDVLLTTDVEPMMDIHGKKRALMPRTLSAHEMDAILTEVAGPGSDVVVRGGTKKEFSHAIPLERGQKSLRFRGSAVPARISDSLGYRITLRTIPEKIPSVQELDIDDEIIEQFLAFNKGLIVVIGATGTGKSTTLAALLNHKMEQPDANMNMLTWENPIEFVYPLAYPSSLCLQREIGKECPSFVQGLMDSLRQTPTHSLVGEIRTKDEIELALMAANTGQGVVTTTHANNVATAARRLIAPFEDSQKPVIQGDLFDLGQMFIAQDLLPTVDGKRTAIREYVTMNSRIRERLVEAKNITSEMMKVLVEEGMTFERSARKRLEQGLITEKQYERVARPYQAYI
ncbi:type IV pilus twitching motility protein PilT [Marinobacter shengliensis]|uniref:type IV pilus twitching motility protein PilT n=1 Tax=Marinobacter shengliensis TaxID=1389223 RepID=UPI0014875562|nr:ATPase, T2SS/T4P/T4SS family [Marinobacter shengliensis]